MDGPEFSSWKSKPEYSAEAPELLFSYSAQKEQWLKQRVSKGQLPVAIEGLASDLTEHVLQAFDSLPYVTATSTDIWQTEYAHREPGGMYHIKLAQRPLEGDSELYGEHTVQGRFDSFSASDDGELCVNIQSAQRDLLPRGVHIRPLYSVRVEHSNIQFAEFIARDRLKEVAGEIIDRLEEGASEGVVRLVRLFNDELGNAESTTVQKLQKSSLLLSAIYRQTTATPQLTDSLLEMLKLSLRLDVPHDIKASDFRNIVRNETVGGHTPGGGPRVFQAVTPVLGLDGATDSRSLGLFIVEPERVVKIPVFLITQIRRTEG